MRDLPYQEDENLAQQMRSQSKVISDLYPAFMDLRVKIHSQPQSGDIQEVVRFVDNNKGKLTPELSTQFTALLKSMNAFFKPTDLKQLAKGLTVKGNPELEAQISGFVQSGQDKNASALIQESAELMWAIRQNILTTNNSKTRLQLLDLSLKLEDLIFKNEEAWNPDDVKGQLQKICSLGLASAAAGYMEIHEWEQLVADLSNFENSSLTLEELTYTLSRARSAVEWSTSMFKAQFDEVMALYTPFEPLANSFIDDKIRGSLVLQLGKTVGDLGSFIATESALVNKVMDLTNQSAIRGLNPGYAFGELVVVENMVEDLEVSSDKIYVFQKPPSDLKPVAGIATVAEGNLVSHVQLLARNLGIPNAALSDENLRQLKKYNGTRVFYAVSNKGNVLLKAEGDMTADEKALFAKKERKDEKIAVPVGEIRLDIVKVLNMREVDASNSGKLCGPKAANLGQLKKMYPEDVVEGLVIPFGIFKEHMDQEMPGNNGSYWDFLNTMFAEAEQMRTAGNAEQGGRTVSVRKT